jgi:hypothetical protein
MPMYRMEVDLMLVQVELETLFIVCHVRIHVDIF